MFCQMSEFLLFSVIVRHVNMQFCRFEMSSLYFSVKVQKLTRIIEINEADLVPGECEKVFFTKGKLQ